MSLIPNESYSFPDHFLRAQSRARTMQQKNLAAPATTRESIPARPVVRAPAPAPPRVAPAAATSRATAAPAIKVSANVRPRGLTPRQAAPAPSPSIPRPTKPRPAFVPRPTAPQPKIDKSNSVRQTTSTSAEEFQFDLFPEKAQRRNGKLRRAKLIRFFLVEGLAAIVFIPCAILILLRYLADPTLIMVTNIAAIAAAVAMAIIPIFFFAIGPTLPQGDD